MAHGKPRYSASPSSELARRTTNKVWVEINIYDLLPPGKLSTILWNLGTSLLHSGVVIGDKEYAYGGHDRRGKSGVYWTRPGFEPPGGTYKERWIQGFSLRSQEEIDQVILEASHKYLGPAYHLLENNCNHFTSYLCEQLTGRPAPTWMNRAASIGIRMPCIVPKEWLAPPDAETVDGELVEDEEVDEHTAMLSGREQYPIGMEQENTSSERTEGSDEESESEAESTEDEFRS